jgi:hypothetical protein
MDKATEMQISVRFLDLDFFTSTNISQRSGLVTKAISNAIVGVLDWQPTKGSTRGR